MTAHLDDDTLTALALGHRDAGAEGVADHLRVCPACAAALADLAAAVRGTLAAAPSIAPPDWFAGRVLAAGRAEREMPAGVTARRSAPRGWCGWAPGRCWS